jgi:hypothetical protein
LADIEYGLSNQPPALNTIEDRDRKVWDEEAAIASFEHWSKGGEIDEGIERFFNTPAEPVPQTRRDFLKHRLELQNLCFRSGQDDQFHELRF